MSKRTHNDNVRVCVRVRPFNKKEIDEVGGIPTCTLACHSDTMISCIDPTNPEMENVFPFDCVFWSMPEDQVKAAVPVADQQAVYKVVGVPQLDSMFEGYNGCIFAYGQTSSGKTHSMMGYAGHGRGITPRLCEELFVRIGYKTSLPDDLKKTTYVVKVSFLEIYNEKVQDLLSKTSKGHDLKVVHDPVQGPVVKGLTEHVVHNWEEIDKLLIRGMETRTTAATAMNDTSSRSHAVVQISMEMEDSLGVVGNKKITRPRRSRANLVDLAGSEKISKSKVEGMNLKEAIGINQSLTCLGRVIDGLVENKPHIPYRDSVLTCLLADSLGGNSRTSMVAALSPAAINYDETLSTLRYASRARKIVNKVKINEDPAAALIRELQEEMAKLKSGMAGGVFGTLLPDGTVLTQEAVAERAQEVQEALAKLNELQAREEVAEQEREQKWRAERERIQQKHESEMAHLREEQEQLERQKVELEERHQALQQDIAEKRKRHITDTFKHRSQIGAEKTKKQQTMEQQKRLKSELIAQRFKIASHKARLQEIENVGAKLDGYKTRVAQLENELAAAHKRLQWLEENPIKEYDPQDVTDPRNPVHMVGMPVGEEIVYDGPLCDLCLEQPAQYRCAQPPCNGDVYCVWCDANQHRRHDKRGHKRQPLGSPCECCGAREATYACEGCEMRLCHTCDDHKHAAHKRRNMINAACDFCGLKEAEVACFNCPAKACPACDDIVHRGIRRQNHSRQYQEFFPGDDMIVIAAKWLRDIEARGAPPVVEVEAEPPMPEPVYQEEMYEPEPEPEGMPEPDPMLEAELLAAPELPFAQDNFHTYIPERPKFSRLTGSEQRASPNWPSGTYLSYRDKHYEKYMAQVHSHFASRAEAYNAAHPPRTPSTVAGDETPVHRKSAEPREEAAPMFPFSPRVQPGAISPPITQPRPPATPTLPPSVTRVPVNPRNPGPQLTPPMVSPQYSMGVPPPTVSLAASGAYTAAYPPTTPAPYPFQAGQAYQPYPGAAAYASYSAPRVGYAA